MIRISDISNPLKSLKQCPFFIRSYTMPRDKRPGPIDWTGRTTGGRLLRILRKRALPFPPNYMESLHIFQPSLQTLLDEKNKIENSYRFIDIGYDYKPVPLSLNYRKPKKIEENLKLDKIKSPKDLLKLIDFKPELASVDYDHIYTDWCRDEEGISAIISLANFYGIYRDLFRDTNYKFKDNVVPVKFTDYYPRPEKFLTKEIEQYFPGGIRLDYPEPRPIRMFKPLAPMLIEFNKYINDDEFDAFPVYRGNLIKPTNTQNPPNVVIDASRLQEKDKYNNQPLSMFLNEGITLIGDKNGKYTLGLFNLDSQYGDCEPICHWMLCNIHESGFDEAFSFIPPYGINGLGYSRFVFLLLKQIKEIHVNNIKDFDLTKRKINVLNFINSPETESKPVGLAWFQTFWDDSCKHIFHNILDIREPTFEYIQPKATLTPQLKFPETAPFNVYLDHYRDIKEINKEVLVERLKKINPFEYKQLIKPSKLPPNVHMLSWYTKVPSWYRSTMWKRCNKLGPYRLLRNASKILPSENNLDLDYPIWPHTSKLDVALRNPLKGHPVPYREGKWALPPNQHPSIRIHDEDIKSLRRKEIEEDNKLVEEMEENLQMSKD